MREPASRRLSADRVFLWSLLLTTVLRALLAAVVPLTGDEAYFVLWGSHPAGGYYDHTPMAGWWLAGVLALGHGEWLVRVPALLTVVGVALLLRRAVAQWDAEKAGWIGALYLWSPHSVANFFTTTDTPLLLFAVLSMYGLCRALRSDRWWEYLLAGGWLGLAFLSKYFAVLLGAGVAVFLLGFAGRRRWRGLGLVLLGVMPSALQNIAWNRENGWVNILFNLYNRTGDAGFEPLNVAVYAGVVLFPLGPLAWALARGRVVGRLSWREALEGCGACDGRVYAVLAAVPIVLLLGVSLLKPVGLHWPLAFFPGVFAALACFFSAEALRRLLRPMVVYGSFFVALGLLAMALPVELLCKHRSYDSIVLGTHPQEVLAAMEPLREGRGLATPSYAKSALLAFHAREDTRVLGIGSHHGRQNDLLADFRELEGCGLVVLCDRPSRVQATQRWFARSEVKEIAVRGAVYFVVVGDGFRYEAYREEVLAEVARRFYQTPEWLARGSPPSFFLKRYGLE